MGGLAPRMVRTTVTFLVGAAGLSGLPPLAGFFSKDEILAAAFHAGHRWLWALLLLGAFMTAFYSFRVVWLAFFGAPRVPREIAQHIHESPTVMTIPLGVLAGATVLAGLALGIPLPNGTAFARFLAPVFPLSEEAGHGGLSAYVLLVLSVIVAVAGVLLAWLMYGSRPVRAEVIGRPRNWVHALVLHKYWVDEIYAFLFVRPLLRVAGFCARAFDLGIIDGIVNGIGRVVVGWAQGVRQVQTGYLVNYALTMLLGAVAIVGFLLAR